MSSDAEEVDDGDYRIAIDTCVFEHLFNPQKNDGHITELLSVLHAYSYSLVHDSAGDIFKEYRRRLTGFLKDSEDGAESSILRAWLVVAARVEVEAKPSEALFKAVKQIVVENDANAKVDRVFVYTAGYGHCDLVSNDGHVLGKAGVDRRSLLKRSLRKCKLKHTDILTSCEARQRYCKKHLGAAATG